MCNQLLSFGNSAHTKLGKNLRLFLFDLSLLWSCENTLKLGDTAKNREIWQVCDKVKHDVKRLDLPKFK